MADQQPEKDAGAVGGSASSQPSQPVSNNDFQFTFQAPATSATIEPDPNIEELRNSSSSLSESVRNYPEEFGRTYHAYRAGSYVFPNDHLEQERLDLQNTALVHLFGGKLYFAPLSQETPPKMVLDIATGTGDWAIQMGDEFPSSEIIATDLSPIQPEDVPPNVSFFVEDSSDPWDYTHKFDYIHTRTTAGCWENFETQIAQQAFDSLNPGGWFESQEFNSIVGCDDDTLKPGMALTNWFHEIAVASEICRRPTVFSNTLVEVYKRVGFVDVEERVLKMPMNGWPKDPQLKEIGRMWEHNFMQGLSGFSLSLFNRAYGRTAEETEVLLVGVRREVCDPRIHAFMPNRAVPTQATGEAAGAARRAKAFRASPISPLPSGRTRPQQTMRPATTPGRQLGRLALRPCRVRILSASPSRFFSHTARRPRQQQHQNDPYAQLRYARPLIEMNVPRGQPHVPPPRSSRLFVAGCVAAAVAFYLLNTQTVPVTGRRRFNFLSDDVVIMSQGDAVGAIIAQVQEQGSRVLPDSDPRTKVVKRVMSRLIPVSGLKDLDWEIYVIDDDKTANAFVLPGGKVFVFSGILKICRNEDSVAAVLGHEIAHNVASHAAERLSLVSTGYLTGGCIFFLSGIWTGLTLFGGWALLGGYYLQELLLFLPADRKQEHEADCIGLMMMAEACYDPKAAVGFWERMEAMSKAGGQEVPEMLSTHPSNEHRIANIQHWMPKALEKQSESDCQVTAAFADKFRVALKKRQRVVHIDNL